MPTLATGGFPVSVMPRSPEFPSQLGVVNSVDPDKVYADVKRGLETADALAMNQQRLAAEQAQLGLAQDQAKTQRALLAGGAQRTAAENEAGTQRALLSQGVQPGAAASQIQQNTLAGAQAARATSLLGPEATQTHTVQNPDGTFTTVSAKTSNAVPVESSTATTPFVSGKPTQLDAEVAMLPAEQRGQARLVAAGLAPKAISAARPVIKTFKDADGSTHIFKVDPNTGVLTPARVEDLEGASPEVPVGPSLQSAAAIKNQAATDLQAQKAITQRKLELPDVKNKLESANFEMDELNNQVAKAITQVRGKDNSFPTSGIVGNAISGIYQPSADLTATLDSIKSNQAINRMNELRAAGNGALGFRLTQQEFLLFSNALASLSQKQSPDQLEKNLRIVQSFVPRLKNQANQAFAEKYGALLNDEIGAGAPQPANGQTATNPQTGQKLIFQNGQWTPAQ